MHRLQAGRPRNRGSISGRNRFLSTQAFNRALGPDLCPIKRVLATSCGEIRWLNRQADY